LDSTGPIDFTSSSGCDIVSRQSDSQILHLFMSQYVQLSIGCRQITFTQQVGPLTKLEAPLLQLQDFAGWLRECLL